MTNYRIITLMLLLAKITCTTTIKANTAINKDPYSNEVQNIEKINLENSFVMYGCQDAEIYLDESGTASITPSDVVIGGNYSDPTVSLDKYSFDCSHVGLNEVTVTTSNMNGNNATCTAYVNVIDSIVPVAICQDIALNLDATGNTIITFQHIDAGSFDNCDFADVSLSQYEFTNDDIGSNAVTATIIDSNGNIGTCESAVTVGHHPKLNPPSNLAAFDIPSLDELPVDDGNNPLLELNPDRLPSLSISMSFYPNPVLYGESTLVLENMNQGEKNVSITFYNNMGAEVLNFKTIVEQTDTKFELENLSDLTRGVYTVVAFVGNNRLSERIIIKNY